MATVMDRRTVPDAEHLERLFFFVMALVIAAFVLTGFGAFLAAGISSFRSPWWVHVHALSFMTWIALYITQNLLVLRDRIDQHRRLGRLGAILAAWMVLVGLVLTPVTVADGRYPPVFTPTFFLALDWVNIVCFAALVGTALHFRRRTDWHRRLMLCATVSVIAPAAGRLLVLGGAMTEWTNVGVLLVFVTIAMIADRRIRGRVHPAYLWGFGAIFAMAPLISLLTGFVPLQALAARLAA